MATDTKKKKGLTDKQINILVPIIAVLLGFLVGIIVVILTGGNPIEMFYALIRAVTGMNLHQIGTDRFFSSYYIGEYFVYAMPIILTGLSVAFAFRTGLFNIGSEGQLLLGGFGAVMIGLVLDLPAIIHLPLAILTGVTFGALWGFIPGILKAKFNVHEVVVTIMLNYVALRLTGYLYKEFEGSSTTRTLQVADTATLKSEFLSGLTNDSRLNWGFVLVIIAVIIFWLIIEKTTFGFELRSAGFNKHASKYAGMKVDRNIALSMAISGAFAGLAGVIISIGTFDYGRVLGANEGYGFDGIAVALVGNTTAIGSLLAGLLFGALKGAQPIMQTWGIPRDIANIIVAMIVIFVAMQSAFKRFLQRFKGEEE
jgi:simple sugar transport system permease protein